MAKRPPRKPAAAAPDADPADPPAADPADGAPFDGDPVPDAPPPIRTRDLVDRVARRAGVRRSAARPLVDAVLAELADALASGQPLSLPPLGKVTVTRTTRPGGKPGGPRVLVCRVRLRDQPSDAPASAGDEVLADPDEGR